jgi:signal transduction histidine kinase
LVLCEFLAANRVALIARTRAKVAARHAPRAGDDELESGAPLFLDQLAEMLRRSDASVQAMVRSATEHGRDLLERGFTVAQVVHDYLAVCAAITELTSEMGALITTAEYQMLHRCLDEVIAQAVTEYTRRREQAITDLETERLGTLAHEFRNALGAAMLSFQTLRAGSVGIGGSTASLLDRSLRRLSALVESSIAHVRLESGKRMPERVSVRELMEDVEVGAAMEANAQGLKLSVGHVERGIDLTVDRQLLVAALGNLLQNAFKFTRPSGNVSLVTSYTAERVVIEVADECGGLPPGDMDSMFRAFEQRGVNRSGLGLGLHITRRSVEADGGSLRVRDVPGVGCVFAIELPRAPKGP